jgi:shikimate kinase
MIAFLLGFRGAGKTTLGKAVAGWQNWRFEDLDEIIEAQLGQSILSYVEEKGLEAFRRLEAETLQEILQRPRHKDPLLVGLGGGILDGDQAYQLLKGSPTAKVLLAVAPEELWRRLEPLPDRRKIANLQTFSDLDQLFQKRAGRLKEIATYTVPNQDITQGLRELKKALGSVWQAAL